MMKSITIKDYDEIINLRTTYNQKFDNEILFRGTSNPLVPSLVEKCSYKNFQDLAYKETELLTEFNTYSNLEYKHKSNIPKDWEIRIAARELGLASSLMDWSDNLELVIEFAIHNFAAKSIDVTSIWFLIKKSISQVNLDESTNVHFNDIEQPTFINYSLGSEYAKQGYSRRKFIQGGFFLKQGYPDIIKPLDTNVLFENRLTQIMIPMSIVPKIRKRLSSKINLDQDPIPMKTDLDNICKELNAKYA